MAIRKAMITTKDNPYDPFENFSQWFVFDVEKGYNSCAYLGRIVKTSDALSEQEQNQIIEEAIDEIIKYDIFNIYEKRIKEVEDTLEEK
jgi:hypothetical protein